MSIPVSYRASPVLIDPEFDCPKCGNIHKWEICPMCGSDVFPTFGIGFGGFGETTICENFCGWTYAVTRYDEHDEPLEIKR